MQKQIKLFLFLLLICAGCVSVAAKSSLVATGSFSSEIQYTPEQRWEAYHRFQMFQELNFSGDVTFYANLGGWLPRAHEQQPFPERQPAPQFRLNRLYALVKGPAYIGGKPFQIGIGDVALAYSPYSIWLNRWDKDNILTDEEMADPVYNYNMVRRGISVDEISFVGHKLSAFYIWDGLGKDEAGQIVPYPHRTAFGAKLEGKHLSFIYGQYLDAAVSEETTPDELVLEDEYLEEDRVFEVVLKEKGIGPFIVSGNFATHVNLLPGKESQGELALFHLRLPVAEEAELIGKYFNYGLDFNPRYRDRTPRFDPYTGRKLNWNETDRYRGQKGYALGIRAFTDEMNFALLTRQYHKNTDSTFGEILAEGKIGTEKVELEGLFSFSKENKPRKDFETKLDAVSYEIALDSAFLLKRFSGGNLYLTGCLQDKKDEYTKTEYQYGLRYIFTGGRFRGLKVDLGRRELNGMTQERINLEYQLPLGITLMANYATPNFVESGEYDQGGEPIMRDNCIKLISEFKF